MSDGTTETIKMEGETALGYSALAAWNWCNRARLSGQEVLWSLMDACSWVTRLRAYYERPAVTVYELTALFSAATSEWLPGGPNEKLIEEGETSVFCEELAAEMGSNPSMEVEQRVLRRAMENLQTSDDAEATYTAFRRFLVEHAVVRLSEAAAIARSVGIELAELYQEIPRYSVTKVDDQDCFYPCPRCNWPMKIAETRVSCAFSSVCLHSGAFFRHADAGLLPLGKLPAPDAIPVPGWAALRQGVWRYTTLPGLEELELERRLKKTGADVVLWPYVDRYDLDVRRSDHHWRVDVKDYASSPRLARHLEEKPVAEPIWIVVPDRKRDQVQVLRSVVSTECGYRFTSASKFVQMVRGTQ